MKSKTLDIDKIGGLEPLTKEEEKKISEFLKRTSSKEKPRRKSKSRGVNEKVE